MKRIAFISCLTLSACATTTSTFQTMNQSYVGKPAEMFFMRNGAPESTFTMKNGDKLYAWKSGGDRAGVGGAVSLGFELVCKLQIHTDKDDTIKEVIPLKDSDGVWQLSRCAETLR